MAHLCHSIDVWEGRTSVAIALMAVRQNGGISTAILSSPEYAAGPNNRAVIESHLRYANVIWGSLPKSKLNTLQRLQDRARSIIGKARLKDNWSHNWLTVEQLTKFDRSVMTYKIISRQCPESLWHKYDHRTQHSNYRTRNCRDLQIPRNNLEYVKKGFHYSALKAWNEIPIDIRELPTLSKFKKQLKSYYTC